jgi:drug/metabolite transporter (DMT)-like permease
MSSGVIFALLAYASYSCADALVKGVGSSLSVFEVGFMTTLFSIIPVVLTRPANEPLREIFHMRRPWLVTMRGLSGVVSTMLVIYAFAHIPLAETYALVFLTPIIVTALSVFTLGETMTLRRWILLMVGFCGVMLVVRPGFREVELGHIAAILCAVFASFNAIILRAVSPTEKRTSIVGMVILTALVINGILMIPTFVLPNLHQWVSLIAIGLLGGTGHILMASAARLAPANLIAPAQYSQILFAVVLGGIFFAELPDAIAFIGLAIVIVSGLGSVVPVRARRRFGADLLWRRQPTLEPLAPESVIPVQVGDLGVEAEEEPRRRVG